MFKFTWLFEKKTEDFIVLKNRLKQIKDINIIFKICKELSQECEIIYNNSNRLLRYIGLSNSFLVFLVTTSTVLTDIYKDTPEEREKLKTFHVIYAVLLYFSSAVSAAKWYRGDSYKNSIKEVSDKLASIRRNIEITSQKRRRNTTLEEYQEYLYILVQEYHSVVEKLPDIGGQRLDKIIKRALSDSEKNEDCAEDNVIIIDLSHNVDPAVSMLYNKEELKFELDRFNETGLE